MQGVKKSLPARVRRLPMRLKAPIERGEEGSPTRTILPTKRIKLVTGSSQRLYHNALLLPIISE